MAKARKILLVSNEYEAMRYKKRFPTLLDGAILYFPDEMYSSTKRAPVHALYYTDSIKPIKSLFARFQPLVSPIALSI